MLQGTLAFALRLFFYAQSLLLLFQPGRVVPLPGDTVASVQLQDPTGDVIQKIAVMRYCDDGTLVVLQVMLQPGDRFCVQVVGWLIQKQDVRFGQE